MNRQLNPLFVAAFFMPVECRQDCEKERDKSLPRHITEGLRVSDLLEKRQYFPRRNAVPDYTQRGVGQGELLEGAHLRDMVERFQHREDGIDWIHSLMVITNGQYWKFETTRDTEVKDKVWAKIFYTVDMMDKIITHAMVNDSKMLNLWVNNDRTQELKLLEEDEF